MASGLTEAQSRRLGEVRMDIKMSCDLSTYRRALEGPRKVVMQAYIDPRAPAEVWAELKRRDGIIPQEWIRWREVAVPA